MNTRIRFLGTAAFEIITASGKRVLVDPYLDENPVSPYKVDTLEEIDLLLVTHAAYDHLGDAEKILRKFPDLKLVCAADVRGYLMHRGIEGDRLRAIPWGMMIEEAGIKVRPVESRHWSYIQTEEGLSFSSIPLGFIVYTEDDVGVYHSGDTALFSDLKLIGELYKPKVGLINVGVPEQHMGAAHGVPTYLTGEMDAEEAALACEWLKLDYAIPCHHDNPELPQVKIFGELLRKSKASRGDGPEPVILKPGESFEL